MADKHKTIKYKATKSKKLTSILNSPLKQELSRVNLTFINPLTVETGWLTRVYIGSDDITELDNSWAELQLLLLGLLMNKYPDSYLSILVNYSILSEGLDIRREEVYHAIYDEDMGYEIYKLGPSGPYLELRQSPGNKLNVILKLFRALKIDPSEVSLDIIPIKLANINTDKLGDKDIDLSDIERVTSSVMLDNLPESNAKLREINISALNIFGYRQETKSSTHGLIIFMLWAHGVYGEEVIQVGKKLSNDIVGIANVHDIEKYLEKYVVERVGSEYLYIAPDNMTILKFISAVAEEVGILGNLIEVEYQTFKLR